MFSVIVTVMCTSYDSCLSSCYDYYLLVVIPVMIPVIGLCHSHCDSCLLVMYSRYDYHMVCNSDSIRLDFCGMRQRYIYEGFLVWITPSMY